MATKRSRDEFDTGPALGDLVHVPDEHLAANRRPKKPHQSSTPLVVGGGIAAVLALGAVIFFLARSEPVTAEGLAPLAPEAPAEVAKAPEPTPPPPVAPPAPPPKSVEKVQPVEQVEQVAPVEAVQPVEEVQKVEKAPAPIQRKKKRAKKAPDRRTERELDSAMDRLLDQDE